MVTNQRCASLASRKTDSASANAKLTLIADHPMGAVTELKPSECQPRSNMVPIRAGDVRRAYYGQIYPAPLGFLKQPTDSGIKCLGSQSTTAGKKIQNAMAAKNMM